METTHYYNNPNPKMVHNVDGEKWSAFSITAAIGGEKEPHIWSFCKTPKNPISKRCVVKILRCFRDEIWRIAIWYWTRKTPEGLTYKNVQLSLSELLGFHQASTIDESLLCDQLTLEGALHCITFIIQFGFDLFAVPCASMGIIVCRWCY